MYKTRIEKFLLGDNISVSVVKEHGDSSGHYALVKIGLFGMNSYAICVLGDDYALETVGDSLEAAELLFDTAVREGVSPMHVYDVVSDFRHGEGEEKI